MLEPHSSRITTSLENMIAYAQEHFSSATDIPVRVRLEEGKLLPQAQFHGGQSLHTCTSAFSVQEKGFPYRKGILTSGHCKENQDPLQKSRIRFVKQRFKYESDIQWHRAVPPHIVRSLFRSTRNQLKVPSKFITARKHMMGRYVCHYGRTSGHSCGTVVSIHSRPRFVWRARDFVRVRGRYLRHCAGDSGGPWFKGNRAYGVHSGGQNVGSCRASYHDRAVFSAIGAGLYYLNLKLL
jgi:hypothetical protein